MRRMFWLLGLVVFGAWVSSAFAQLGASVRPKVILLGEPSQANCPVNFWAQRYGLTAVMRETANGPVREPTQSLRLRFETGRTGPIERMTVLAYGTSSTPQVMPVLGTRSPSELVSGPLELTSKDGHFDSVQYVSATTMPMITRIEITEIRYRDGTTWREPARDTCAAVPSLFVLVDAETGAR